ncbi:MAG TPA: pyridoxamine 5'-phosphate oxidase family protein [Dongiaceae bacterium]|jgi:general stress protein 26
MAIDTQDRLYDIIKDFNNALLVTLSNGRSHARPMAVAEIRRDGDVFFATSLQSPKIAEIEANPEVIVTFQSGSQFASISGNAEIVRDRALVDKLWSEAWKVWFPGGKSDPTLCLIRVDAREGEYWDNAGAQGIKNAYKMAKAYMQGKTPGIDEKQHAKVRTQ